MTKRLSIIAHAPSPNTERLRDALCHGAARPPGDPVTVILASPFDASPNDILDSQAVILMTPENLGYMSGALKDFFDRIYYPCLEHTQGMPYALVIRAGQDGTGTRRGVETIVTGLRWRAVAEPLVCRGEWRDTFLDDARDLGQAMSEGLSAGIF